MRVSTTVVGLVGTLAGAAAAVTGYQHLAAIDDPHPSATTAVPAVGRPLQAAPPRIRVRLAGCKRPARLVRGACVTTVTRTRVVYDPAPPQPVAVQPVAPPTRPATRPARAGSDDSAGHEPAEHESGRQDGREPGDD